MQALRVHTFGTPPEVRLDDLPDPAAGPGEVVVEVEAIGVNPVDTYVAAGTYAIKPDLPYVPGMDAAGTVREVGEGVTHWQPGDRVIVALTTSGKLQGTYADTCVCRDEDVYELPANLSFAQGAAINTPYVTAFRALIDVAKVRPGETVLVHGATGAVGVACVQIAKAHKLEVYATGGSEAGREMLKQIGADHVLNHRDANHLDALPERGVDVILEMATNENLPADMARIAPHGRIIVIGNRGECTINPRLLMAKQAAVIGLTYWSDGDMAVRRAYAALAQGMSAGDLAPVIQAEYPLARALDAWNEVINSDSRGKIVLVP